MSKQIKQSITTLSILMIVIGLIFLANGIILAWTEPTSSPPDGNVAAPINVSSIAQTKLGNLGIGTDVISSGLTLDVEGKIGATEYCDKDGNNCLSGFGDNLGNHKATQNLDMNNSKIINLANPSGSKDAVNKGYVDSRIAGLSVEVNKNKIKYKVMASNSTYTGNLGGIAGANQKCVNEFGEGWQFADAGIDAPYSGMTAVRFSSPDKWSDKIKMESYAFRDGCFNTTDFLTLGPYDDGYFAAWIRNGRWNCNNWTSGSGWQGGSYTMDFSAPSSEFCQEVNQNAVCNIKLRILCEFKGN